MAWAIVTPPAVEPVTLDQVRADARVTERDEDLLLLEYITAAREYVERVTNRALMPQQRSVTLPGFPPGAGTLRLTGGPFRAIDSITYRDTAGASQTMDLADVVAVLDATPRLQHLTCWPATACREDAVVITADVGYADAAAVPATLKRAIRHLVVHWFENRSPVRVGNIVSEVPLHVSDLIRIHTDGTLL